MVYPGAQEGRMDIDATRALGSKIGNCEAHNNTQQAHKHKHNQRISSTQQQPGGSEWLLLAPFIISVVGGADGG